MRELFKLLSILLCLSTVVNPALAQADKGNKLLSEKKYKEACQVLEPAIAKDPGNVALLHQLGKCYLGLKNKRLATMYLQKAVDRQDDPPVDLLVDLGTAYHLSHQFEQATEVYERCLAISKDKSKIKNLIDQCQTGKDLMANPLEVSFSNLGNQINTPYNEFSPFLSVDQQTIYFTSTKPSGLSKMPLETGKVYASQAKGTWDKAKPVFPNSAGVVFEENIVGLSPDGKTMLLNRPGKGSDLFFSYLQGGKWSKPEAFKYNSPKNETGACLSMDGKNLFFISDRGGNKDLYHCMRIDSRKWTKPTKVSNKVNTAFDEEYPYLDASGKYLYFSSKGQQSMGGYDVLRIRMAGKEPVGLPENVGYPINSASDDVYYIPAADGKSAWYATERDGGFGGLDIYSIRLPGAIEQGSLTVFKGITIDNERNMPVKASVAVLDVNTNSVISKLESNNETGYFSLTLPQGKTYTILVEKQGYLFYSESITIKDGDGYKEIDREIKLATLKVGARILLNNIYFDPKKSSIKRESGPELLRLVNLMRQNPGIVVEIGGHTDNVMEFTENLKLSDSRARSVVDYLVAIGITSNRLIAKGYGSMKPIADNNNSEGRKQNNRMEFTIISL